MSGAARKFVLAIALLLLAGVTIGWYYGEAVFGLAFTALLLLAWQVSRLLAFDRAVRNGSDGAFRYGEGIWAQLFSRFRYEREKSARRKRDYRSLLREIRNSANAMPDGAVVLDAGNEIVLSNRAARELAGLKRKKDRGQRIDNILRAPQLTHLLQADNPELSIEITSPVVDGCWLNCRVVPYGAGQKLLLIRDVTERYQLNKMRRDFIANASHELRTPLTVITGYLDGLADDEALAQEWARPVAQMQGQAQRMQQILGDMLELSRLESAGEAGTEEPVDMAALVESASQALQGHADVAPIERELEPGLRLRGDAREIESVVVNLLSNAVRYTPREGRILVRWRAVKGGAELSVADTGEGIDPGLIPRLTERFFRVDRGRSREDGGTGLGLAIVKHVLARHGAELIITSQPGEGSEFRCRFPRERVADSSPNLS